MIYLDNAATTPMSPLVVEAMLPYMTTHFGNPSAAYGLGLENRLAIEHARKMVAGIFNTSPDTIYFTSGGTESNNTAIKCAVRELGCKHIISSPLEHHATLHTIEYLEKKGEVRVSYVLLHDDGHVNLNSLEELLASSEEKTLVSLMHANNEIGNVLDIQRAGELCRKYGAYFHSDTVQTVGHYPISLKEIPVDFITASGHKFHGPKGSGILYVNKKLKMEPFIHGGSQERGMRAGTENLYGIIGFAAALDMATKRYEEDKKNISQLKVYMKRQLMGISVGATFNGDCSEDSLYTVLSVGFPKSDRSQNLLLDLNVKGICASGGSACSSGAGGSHVMRAIDINHNDQTTVRFSFSRYTMIRDIDVAVDAVKEILNEC